MTQAKCCSNVAVLIIYLATCQKIILLMFEGFFFIMGWRRIILRNISMNVGGAGGVYLGAGQGGGG